MKSNLLLLLKDTDTCITYVPFGYEIDPFSVPYVKGLNFSRVHILPKDKGTDPYGTANYLKNSIQSRCCIFIPGTQFDRFGTRRGRGKGWFDRFLASIPSEWIRIGITKNNRFSPTALIRNPWDQLMDWIICQDGSMWKVIETKARRSQDAYARIVRSTT